MNRLSAGMFFWLLSLASGWVWAADSPDALVEQTSQRMLVALNQDRAMLQQNPDKIYNLVDDILLPHFDFKTMLVFERQFYKKIREKEIMEEKTLLIPVLSVFGLLILSAFFSSSETALTSVTRAKIHKLKMEGHRKGVKYLKCQ